MLVGRIIFVGCGVIVIALMLPFMPHASHDTPYDPLASLAMAKVGAYIIAAGLVLWVVQRLRRR